MRNYSISGDFGKVKIFDVFPASGQLSSVDQITSLGWHRVNRLYRINRPAGFSAGLFLLTLSGKGFVKVGNKCFAATSGSVAVIPPGVPNEYRNETEEDWEFYWIHYRGSYSDLCVADLTRDGNYLFDVGKQWIELFFEDHFRVCSAGVERELENTLWFSRLLHLLLKKSVSSCHTSDEKGLTKQMMAFLESDMKNDFSLEELVEHFHYSKEYLIRLFKKATGITPYRYWLLLRIKRSCYDLEVSDKSIAEIALSYGYKEMGSYSKQFKKCYGISPAEYRRLHKFVQN